MKKDDWRESVHRDGGRTGLASADADRLFDGIDENFPIANFVGTCRADNGCNSGVNHIVAEIGRDSADLEDMSILQERNGDIQLQFKSLLAEQTSVDYAEVVSELQQSINLLQFTYSASTTILQQSILDYF